jgi:hypothetical protein
VLLTLVLIALIVLFPQLALWLPWHDGKVD